MFRIAAIFISVASFVTSAIAQEKEPQLPPNTIDCKQFKKIGPQEWAEIGTAVFDLGEIKDINLSNQPVIPRYFKFGGIDLFPVVEQKCGTDTKKDEAAQSGQATMELGAAPQKPELQGERSSAAAQSPTQAISTGTAPTPELKTVNSQPENLPCGDRKSIYAADVRAGQDGVRASIEITVSKDGTNPEFIILETKNNKNILVYKGKIAKGRFMFASHQSKQKEYTTHSLFTPVRAVQNTISIVPKYIKPHRDGSGAAILYLDGLTALFVRGNFHRLKSEGNPPTEILPDTFYFDRCE